MFKGEARVIDSKEDLMAAACLLAPPSERTFKNSIAKKKKKTWLEVGQQTLPDTSQ